MLQTSEKQLFQGKHPICQTSENKKCCKHPKSSFSRANFRCVKHPKNQKVLQTCENQLHQGKHPICQTSEKPKSAANIRKPALPWRKSDMPNIQKTKKCCKQPKSSFSRANFRYVRHPKNQKMLQTCENQLHQGKYPICQTSEKPKSAANIRKPALPGRTSDMSNIRKTEKCSKHPNTSFTMSNIRKTKRCWKHLKSKFSRAALFVFTDVSLSEKPKSAANMRKPALPGQTSDMSNIRKTKNCCKHPKTSFNRANIRYVK